VDGGSNIVQETRIKAVPKKNKCKKHKMAVCGGLTSSYGKKGSEKQRGKGKIYPGIARRDKKAFLSYKCKEIEENNRMGKTRNLLKKIRATEHLMQRWAQ